MAKNTTKYTVVNAEGIIAEGVTKKAKAVEIAEAARGTSPVDVMTSAGTVVHTVPAIKKIKMSKPYTRVVELPAEFVVPDGFRVCYTRARKGLAVLHNFDEDYRLFNLKTQTILPEVYPTTRAAGRALVAFAG